MALDDRRAVVDAAADFVVDIEDAQKGRSVLVQESFFNEMCANPIQFAAPEDEDVGCHIKSIARAGDFNFFRKGGQTMNATWVHGVVPHGSFVFEVTLHIIWPPCPRIGSVGRGRLCTAFSLLDALQG